MQQSHDRVLRILLQRLSDLVECLVLQEGLRSGASRRLPADGTLAGSSSGRLLPAPSIRELRDRRSTGKRPMPCLSPARAWSQVAGLRRRRAVLVAQPRPNRATTMSVRHLWRGHLGGHPGASERVDVALHERVLGRGLVLQGGRVALEISRDHLELRCRPIAAEAMRSPSC